MYPHKSDQQFIVGSRCLNAGALAAEIGRRLVEIECRGRGDLEASFYRLEKRHGIGRRTWRDWWHRKAHKGVLLSTLNKLVTAYEIACAHRVRQWEREHTHARGIRLNGSTTVAEQLEGKWVGSQAR